MKVVCSYCDAEIGDKEPLDDPRTSHGVCDACFDHFDRQWGGLSLGEYLDGSATPVIVLDSDSRLIAANQAMADRMGMADRELYGLLGGEALECAHARRPGGCGQQVCCQTCTIRTVVREVADTGRSVSERPAVLEATNGEIRLRISARPDGDAVVLTIVETGRPTK